MAALWCPAFAVVHVYWAVGGQVGLAESAGPDLTEHRPAVFVLLGLRGTALVLLIGAALGARPARSVPVHRLLRMAGWLVGCLLLVRALALEIVLLTDAAGVASAGGPAQTLWSLTLWNPWFTVGGIAFLLAARGRSAPDRRDEHCG